MSQSPTPLAEFDDLIETIGNPDNALVTNRELITEANGRAEALFQQGADIEALLLTRSQLIDRLLLGRWQSLFGICNGDDSSRPSLIAVGGYGRSELHPSSDIDLLILLDNQHNKQHDEALSRFITGLWDFGLKIGHSVRTLDECETEARNDVTVITNLMESRWLCGSKALFDAMQSATDSTHMWPADVFFDAKREEQQQRHNRFHNTAYNLEPNLKEGPGGLRDVHTIAWTIQRHSGCNAMRELVTQGYLSQQECEALTESRNHLWRIRFALHQMVGRSEDRLLFDYQADLAERLGFEKQQHNLAVEQFMQGYYRAIGQLSRLNEMLMQLLQERLVDAQHAPKIEPINQRFQINNGYIEYITPSVAAQKPLSLLEIFLILQQHPDIQGVRAETIRLIRDNCHRIDQRFREDIQARSLFMEILRQPSGITHEFRRMVRYGVLQAYLPAFANIVGRMQYDLFHAYTVDEHTLFVLRNTRRLMLPEFADELPHCYEVSKRLPKPELLYLAALFHDIAKGRGGDHSELGATDADNFCRQHGISEYDTGIVVWLVQNHLVMSTTSQKKDISDPEVVAEFATSVGTETRLNYIYLLTVSDIRGTNPKLWNSWRATLMQDLYKATRRVLRNDDPTPIDKDILIEETRNDAKKLLLQHGVSQQQVDHIWEKFPDDYFLRHDGHEIACHTDALLSKPEHMPHIAQACKSDKHRNTEFFVYTVDRPYLFTHLTGCLARLGLNIVDARVISTQDGNTFCTFAVLEDDGNPINDAERSSQIAEALHEVLEANPATLHSEVNRHQPRSHKHFQTKTRVQVSLDEAQRRTTVEVVTADHPGLLSLIGRQLSDLGVNIQNARISTIGERVEDVFYVVDSNTAEAITDSTRCTKIETQLLKRLEEEQT